jgi:hypothetical protein
LRSHGGEGNPVNSTCQVILVIHFAADAMSCQCSNVGIYVVLVEQICNKTKKGTYHPPCLDEGKDENIIIMAS